ncbi:MAG: N-acetylmuramoyl-L-alanine amidase [Tannerellaceae bacterium]|jgi:N-acetylmuramoyl-L-alanine amidase|nr:N-acetylmuramoyl-L-alanine amidase [Tannerellaceae bacterium]
MLRHMSLMVILLLLLPALRAEEKDFILVIDAGHGGKDPGARGSLINEKVINLSVALKLGNLISENHDNIKVIYTRKTDRFIGLDERANIANRSKADLFISIHANAIEKARHISGTETFILGLASSDENLEVAKRENSAILLEENYQQKYENFDPNSSESYIIFGFMQNGHMEQSIQFASEIQKSFKGAKRNDRGVKQAGLLVLRKTGMPGVLIELGFITNGEEERYMKSVDGQNKLAKAIYEAFRVYIHKYYVKQNAATDSSKTPSKKNETKAETTRKPSAAASSAPETTSPAAEPSKKAVIYKIQILTSKKKLPANSRQFKGYKNVGFYEENGLYKYTYGESSDLASIKATCKKIQKDFKDAFIIAFKDGKKMK